MNKKKIVNFFSLILSDYIAVLLCFFLAYSFRNEVLTRFFPPLLDRPTTFVEYYLSKSYMFFIWIVVFLNEKLYTKRYSFWDETRFLLKSTTIAFAAVMIAVFVTRVSFFYSRAIIVIAWLLSLLFIPIFRYLTKILLIKLHFWRKSVVIVGSHSSCTSLIDAIRQNKTMGYKIIGCLGEFGESAGKEISGIEILGHPEDFLEIKSRVGFEDIIVALPDLPGDQLVELLKEWERSSETIRYVPRTGDMITAGVEIENIGRHLTLSVRKNLAKPWNVFMKDTFEFLFSLVLTVVFLPLFLLIALAVKLDSKGSVFFVQERYGHKGRKFGLLKFRSMYQDADQQLKNFLEQNPQKLEEWDRYKKLKSDDPRVTRVGKFLRKHSLDELPQLLNVLKREMNVVGPRPYIMEELKEVESLKTILLQVKPGITGLWQISGRSELPFQERLTLDEYYLRNWSLWLDIVILIKTVKVFISGEGAY